MLGSWDERTGGSWSWKPSGTASLEPVESGNLQGRKPAGAPPAGRLRGRQSGSGVGVRCLAHWGCLCVLWLIPTPEHPECTPEKAAWQGWGPH